MIAKESLQLVKRSRPALRHSALSAPTRLVAQTNLEPSDYKHVALGLIFLGERLTAPAVLGTLMAVAGLAILQL